jgi:hypothetical protein
MRMLKDGYFWAGLALAVALMAAYSAITSNGRKNPCISFNIAHNQKLIDAEQLTAPVVLKGDGRAPHTTIEGGPF